MPWNFFVDIFFSSDLWRGGQKRNSGTSLHCCSQEHSCWSSPSPPSEFSHAYCVCSAQCLFVCLLNLCFAEELGESVFSIFPGSKASTVIEFSGQIYCVYAIFTLCEFSLSFLFLAFFVHFRRITWQIFIRFHAVDWLLPAGVSSWGFFPARGHAWPKHREGYRYCCINAPESSPQQRRDGRRGIPPPSVFPFF